VAAEFAAACIHFPIAWVKNQEQFDPIALLGLDEGQNLFVNHNNQWVVGYVPAHLRAQPFRLLRATDGRLTLAVREDTGLVTGNEAANPFFDTEGQLSGELQSVLNMLRRLEENRAATQEASLALADAGVLEAWAVAPVVNGEKRHLGGLFRVSEKALEQVDAAALERLRDTGALAMAYRQQVSQQLIQRLEVEYARRAEARIKRSDHPGDRENLGFETLGPDTGISFGGLGPRDEP